MVGLASDLKMQTTAEGVETQDELLLVRNLGCSLVQGYIFGRPMPAEEARELAAKGSASLPDAHLPPREPRIRIIRAALLHYHGRGERRAPAQHLERRRAGRMPRGDCRSARRSSSTSPPAA